jgi:SNF2 family DNA or RNA helicase
MLTYSDLNGYQLEYINNSVKVKRHMLMADMGLGKTVMMHTAVQKVLQGKSMSLVVCPASVANTVWQEEVEEWEHLQTRVVALVGTAEQRRRKMDEPARVEHTLTRR